MLRERAQPAMPCGMKYFALCLLAFSVAFTAHALREPNEYRIVAIVNDEVISSRDLLQRLMLNMTTLRGPMDAKRQRAFEEATLQALVDERLKLQEAERYSINITPEEIDKAIRQLEKQQRLAPGTITAKLEESGLPIDILREQLKGDLAWQKLLSRQVQRNVSISEEEIDQAQTRISRGEKIEQAQIASVILPISEDTQPEVVLGYARELRSQMLAGTPASQLLDQFEGKVRLEYGPLSWVETDLMSPELREAITGLEKGDIAQPVLTDVGYQVVRLMDKRYVSTLPEENAEVALKEIVLNLSEQSMTLEIEAMMDIARNIAKYPGTCQEEGLAGMNNLAGLNIDVDYKRVELARLQPDLRQMIEPLSVTQITEPFAAPDGIHLLMLCEKMAMPLPKPDRDKVRAALYQEKLQLEAEKYLRRLRREAFIDVRA